MFNPWSLFFNLFSDPSIQQLLWRVGWYGLKKIWQYFWAISRHRKYISIIWSLIWTYRSGKFGKLHQLIVMQPLNIKYQYITQLYCLVKCRNRWNNNTKVWYVPPLLGTYLCSINIDSIFACSTQWVFALHISYLNIVHKHLCQGCWTERAKELS